MNDHGESDPQRGKTSGLSARMKSKGCYRNLRIRIVEALREVPFNAHLLMQNSHNEKRIIFYLEKDLVTTFDSDLAIREKILTKEI